MILVAREKIVKPIENFLNFRLLNASLKIDKFIG